METKYVRTPFEIDLAKKITNGEAEGRIVTRDGRNIRIICWDRKGVNPIVALIEQQNGEEVSYYPKNGSWETDQDLMLEVPEYMTFKEGDVLTYRPPHGDRWCIFVYKERVKDVLSNYVTYDCDLRGNNIITFGKSFYNAILCKPSTEEEKQNLFDALKESKEPEAKECLKKLGIEIEVKPKYEFKPFDKVLGRSSDTTWCADIFSHKSENGKYVCVGFAWSQCIPYNEQTAHLLGTSDNI